MPLDPADAGNAAQIAYWNGPGGRRWIPREERQDAFMTPITEALFARAALAPGERAIDVGCGCGSTTLEIARRVGPTGGALGVDVSAPMIERARERALTGAQFLLTDATTHAFAPRAADVAMSRFGVMFFADPARAFANLRGGLKPGGRLVFVCWRAAKFNPWQTVPLKAACRHVPRLPESGPEDPGPFAFANPARVEAILAAAGFAEIALTPMDVDLDLAAGQGLEAALVTAQEIGASSRALEGQPEAQRAAAVEEIRAALTPYQRGQSVPLGAAIWIVEAVNP